MRASLPLSFLLVALLSACASQKDIPPSKHISQTGALRVHPGLLGQPVPPELQEPSVATAPAAATSEGKMQMDEAGLRTQRSVYFDFDSATIKAEFEAMLRAHADYLAKNRQVRIRVEGNADERGGAEYNSRLGMRRAEAVRQAIVGQGAGEKQVTIKTLGELRPKLRGHNEESWAENRRADIVYENAD